MVRCLDKQQCNGPADLEIQQPWDRPPPLLPQEVWQLIIGIRIKPEDMLDACSLLTAAFSRRPESLSCMAALLAYFAAFLWGRTHPQTASYMHRVTGRLTCSLCGG